jgi:uncharacterized membrane protein YozB (DUF420 family)
MNVQDLPAVNASLNGLSAVFLACGFWAIRRDRPTVHRNFMLAALGSSVLFLACYLTYHFQVTAVTRFREPAAFRPIYLAVLLSHTLLAAALLPLVLGTIWNAARKRFDRHRRWARWTWPIWMYVSVTGVLIYLLLYQIFPQTMG